MSDTDSTLTDDAPVVDDDSHDTDVVNTPGDDNVIVEVAPADVTVNVEVTPEVEEAPSTEPADLSSVVAGAITTALAPLLDSVNSLSVRVAALETPATTDELPPVTEVVEEPVTEPDEDQNEDSPPKSRREHWFFRDHDLHKTGS